MTLDLFENALVRRVKRRLDTRMVRFLTLHKGRAYVLWVRIALTVFISQPMHVAGDTWIRLESERHKSCGIERNQLLSQMLLRQPAKTVGVRPS